METSSPPLEGAQLVTLTTDAIEFVDYLNTESHEEIEVFVTNVFGNMKSLAGSFKFKIQKDSGFEDNPEAAGTSGFSGTDTDWDGLKRVYEELEARNMQEILAQAHSYNAYKL